MKFRGFLGKVWSDSCGLSGEVSPSDSDCEIEITVLFFLQKASSLPDGKSRRERECCEFAQDVQPLSRRRTQEGDCGVIKGGHRSIKRLQEGC